MNESIVLGNICWRRNRKALYLGRGFILLVRNPNSVKGSILEGYLESF